MREETRKSPERKRANGSTSAWDILERVPGAPAVDAVPSAEANEVRREAKVTTHHITDVLMICDDLLQRAAAHASMMPG
jgi:hypothetical protein